MAAGESEVLGATDLFEILRDGVPRTRAELSQATGLARSTVALRIDVLTRSGLVAPMAEGESTGGRPPSRVGLVADAFFILAADVGASHVTVAISNLLGEILAVSESPVRLADGPDPVLERVLETGDELLERLGEARAKIAGVGIGLPGPVHFESGRPSRPPLMPGWDGFDVPGWFREHLDASVVVDNDVNVMALGELAVRGTPVDHLLFVKVATGIGAGIISEGELQRGALGAAGDIGHIRVSTGDGVICSCGNEGCLEAVASAQAVAATLTRAGSETASGAELIARLRAGDVDAIRLVRQAGRDVGEVLSACIHVLNPAAIVIGGMLAAEGEYLLAGIREVVYSRSMPLATRELVIETSTAGPLAGVTGASLLAIGRVLSPEGLAALTRRRSAVVG